MRVVWELPVEGGIFATTQAEVIPAGSIAFMPTGLLVAEFAFFALLCCYLLSEGREMWSLGCRRYVVDPWNVFDLLNYALFTCTYVLRYWEWALYNSQGMGEAVRTGNASGRHYNVHLLA